MIPVVTGIALVLLGLGLVAAIVRVVIGPTLPDRILGLDMVSTLGIGIIGAFAVRTGFYLYGDIAVALALGGFVATIALARYVLSRAPQ